MRQFPSCFGPILGCRQALRTSEPLEIVISPTKLTMNIGGSFFYGYTLQQVLIVDRSTNFTRSKPVRAQLFKIGPRSWLQMMIKSLGGRGHKFTNGSLVIFLKRPQNQSIVFLLCLPFLIEFSDLPVDIRTRYWFEITKSAWRHDLSEYFSRLVTLYQPSLESIWVAYRISTQHGSCAQKVPSTVLV